MKSSGEVRGKLEEMYIERGIVDAVKAVGLYIVEGEPYTRKRPNPIVS